MALAVVVLLGIFYGAQVMFHAFTHETTDDAFIDAHVIAMAPKIAGRVTAVHVSDNQLVKKGDPLLEIDPADAAAVVAQRKAALDVARAKERSAQMAAEQADAHLQTLHAGYEAAAANANAAAADAKKAQGDLQRNKELITTGAISRQDYEHSSIDTKSSEATLDSKRKQMDAASAFIKEADKQAQSAPRAGERRAGRGGAGGSGLAGERTLRVLRADHRARRRPGLTAMRPGQPVEVDVDAYPARRCTAMSTASSRDGRASVSSPENATGNFVKVVQRVPVKIILERTTGRADARPRHVRGA